MSKIARLQSTSSDHEFVQSLKHVLGKMRSVQIMIERIATLPKSFRSWALPQSPLYDLFDCAKQVAGAVASGGIEIEALRQVDPLPEDSVRRLIIV